GILPRILRRCTAHGECGAAAAVCGDLERVRWRRAVFSDPALRRVPPYRSPHSAAALAPGELSGAFLHSAAAVESRCPWDRHLFAWSEAMSQQNVGTHRRSFLGRIAAGAGALMVGGWSKANAEVAALAEPPVGDEWVAKITGKYRQVFDNTSVNENFGA